MASIESSLLNIGYLETLSLYPKELKAFLERGGILAWGIVPTSDEVLKEGAESLFKRFKEGVEVLSKKGMDRTLLERAILTPVEAPPLLPSRWQRGSVS